MNGAAPRQNLLLRNRPSHLRDRDAYYQRATGDLETLVQKLRELRDQSGGLHELRPHVERLSLSFKRGLYHAILAAGGDFGRARTPGISREEMVFSDYLKTMYSAARNIESYLSHELMLLDFSENEKGELEPAVRQYIQQTKSFDQDIILRTVDLMASRVSIFNKTFLPAQREPYHHGPVHGGSGPAADM